MTTDIPPYAIAVGVPAEVRKYRFDDKQIEALSQFQWWNFKESEFSDVEKMFKDMKNFA